MTRETKADVAAEVWRGMLDCAMSQVKQAMPALTEAGLTPGHMKILFCIEGDEARPMGSLATQFGCDASTMTWLVDRLEEHGFAERRSLPEDRRVKAVTLTKEGRALKSKLEQRMYSAPPQMLTMDRATLDSLRNLFEKINANPRP